MSQTLAREFYTAHNVLWFPIELNTIPKEPAEDCYGEPKMEKELKPVSSKAERVFNDKTKKWDWHVRDNTGHQLYKREKKYTDKKSGEEKTYNSYKPEQNDFWDFPTENIIKRQNLLQVPFWKKRFNFIAVDTTNMKHIDLDCPEYLQDYKDLLITHPYTVSATKSFGKHINVISSTDTLVPNRRFDLRNEGFLPDGSDVEMLAGQWAYVPIDAIMYNSDCKDMYWNFTKYMLDKTKINKQPKLDFSKNTVISNNEKTPSVDPSTLSIDLINQHRELVDLITMDGAKKNRLVWIAMCDAMKSIGLKNEDWIHFCIRNKFNNGNPDKEKQNLFANVKGNNEIYLLHRYAKLSNPDKHAEYIKKYNIVFQESQKQKYYDTAEKNGDYLEDWELRETTKYKAIKSLFETSHFKLEFPIRYVRKSDCGELQFYTQYEMGEYLTGKEGYNIVGGKGFFNLWRDDKKKSVFSKIVFETNLPKHIQTHYNAFTGFDNNDPLVKKINEDESAFLKVLNRVSNSPIVYEYIKCWFAHIIQKPYKKTNVAVVLYSDTKGVGKNSIVDGFTAILGNKYVGILQDIEDLKRNFNSHLVNKLLIYGDEISFNATKMSNKIKAVITQPTQNLEKKGIDVIKVDDKSNYLFTTNNEHSLKMENGDRRLFMVQCIEEKLSKEMSSASYAEIEDPVKLKQLFNFFMEYEQTKEIDNFDIGISAPPETEYKKNMMYSDMPSYIEMLYKSPHIFKHRKINSSDLYKVAVKYARDNHQSTNFTVNKFGCEMTKYLASIKVKGRTANFFEFGKTHEIRKVLYEANPNYYRYVYQLDPDQIPEFIEISDEEKDNQDMEQYCYI